MLKILFILSIIFVVSFLLFFPFWHVGGHYYRGLLLIYDIHPASGGFIPAPDFVKEITWIRWADPTSFEYVGNIYAKDRFSVYRITDKLKESDPETFRQIQAPLTGEYFYADKYNLRSSTAMILKRVSGSNETDIVTERFDVGSFQPLGAYIFKDKNGVYSYFRPAPFRENIELKLGEASLGIELYKKEEGLDAETFNVDFCEGKTCQASDKNRKYALNFTDAWSFVHIKKIE
jgi:DKNYY family